MKTTLLIALMSLSSFSETSYEDVMKANIEKVYNARSAEELNQAVNAFSRIGQKEKDKWEPYYYASLGYLKISGTKESTDDKDQYLDLALEMIEKARELSPNEDEIHAMIGYIHMIRVSVNPSSRGQKYSALSMESLNKALAIDAENPRALYLIGRMELGIAQFFNSDTSDACDKISTSIELFDRDKKVPALAPSWGKEQAKQVAEYCSN